MYIDIFIRPQGTQPARARANIPASTSANISPRYFLAHVSIQQLLYIFIYICTNYKLLSVHIYIYKQEGMRKNAQVQCINE